MWLGHRLESKTSIESYLDCYRILETLSNREEEILENEVNEFLKNTSKWSGLVTSNKKVKFAIKGKNFFEVYMQRRCDVTEINWDKINGIRGAIVHGKSPDIEYRDDFRQTFELIDELAKKMIFKEIKSLILTNLVEVKNPIYVTKTCDGEFLISPLHENFQKYKKASEFYIEGVPKKTFDNIISKLDPIKKNELIDYYKYRSYKFLAKNIPTCIKDGEKITIQDHIHKSVLSIEPSKKN